MNTITSETDSIATRVNAVASSLGSDDIGNTDIPTEVEVLCDDMRSVVKSQAAEFYAGTNLSESEANIMALNVRGLRPVAISLVLSVDSSPTVDTEAIRESLESIREKYETAAVTYEMLDEHISRSKNWECPRCEALVDLNNYINPPRQCPSCGYRGFLETGKPK